MAVSAQWAVEDDVLKKVPRERRSPKYQRRCISLQQIVRKLFSKKVLYANEHSVWTSCKKSHFCKKVHIWDIFGDFQTLCSVVAVLVMFESSWALSEETSKDRCWPDSYWARCIFCSFSSLLLLRWSKFLQSAYIKWRLIVVSPSKIRTWQLGHLWQLIGPAFVTNVTPLPPDKDIIDVRRATRANAPSVSANWSSALPENVLERGPGSHPSHRVVEHRLTNGKF